MKNIFISYSHKDTDFARKLVLWLEERGYKVWMDKKKILPGANYLESIADGIGKADVFMPLLSPESVSSKWVAREIIYAVENDKDIIPVLVQFAQIPEGLKFAITGIHHVDFSDSKGNSDSWNILQKALQESIPQSSSGNQVSESPDQSIGYSKDIAPASNKQLLDFINSQRKRTSMMAGIVIAVIILCACLVFYLLRDKPTQQASQEEKRNIKIVVETTRQVSDNSAQPASIVIKNGSSGVEATLKLAYGTELKSLAPAAAVGVVYQSGSDTSAWRTLRNGEELSSKDNYRIIFQPENKAYFYVFQIDSIGKLEWIFPRNDSSLYSIGSNPVSSKKWTQVPGVNEAFHLDENLGIEHLYVVATSERWIELEKELAEGSKTKPLPLKAPLELRTRGIGGQRIAPTPTPMILGSTSSDVRQLLTGKKGVLVQEYWFKHVAPDK